MAGPPSLSMWMHRSCCCQRRGREDAGAAQGRVGVCGATQALGWGLFSGALLCLMVLVLSAARGMAYCIRCWIFATGSVMLASQLVSIRQHSVLLTSHLRVVLLCPVMLTPSAAYCLACCICCCVFASKAASCGPPRLVSDAQGQPVPV